MKKFYYNLPDWARAIIALAGLFLLYSIGKGIANRIRENKLKKEREARYNQGSGYQGNDGNTLNLSALSYTLWGLFFDSWTEDEEAIVELVKNVPNNLMREFNNLYAEVLREKKDTGAYNWYNYYKGTTLQGDCSYFLGSAKFNEISAKFNYI